MAMRLSGLMSGMDTDSIIQQLVEARRTKVDDAVKAQKKLEWKQDAWKDLNKKLKSFQNKYLSEMRLSTAYMKKTTKVSDSSAVDVLTGENAVNSVQSLRIDKLAKTAYLTGAEIDDAKGNKVNASTKIKDLGKVSDGSSITVSMGDKSKTIKIGDKTTISDVLNELKSFGLNASFDEKNQRFFVSAKESGKANNFTFSGSGGALTALGLSTKNCADAHKVDGRDAEIYLNGAKFTNSTNVFEINGLTITALQETGDDIVTLTTENDTEGVYDLVKDFITEYSALINEMDGLYNAESAEGYEPLTAEEKEAMTETEIEEWEEKVKSALLRRDENLSSVSSALKSIMLSGAMVNGKQMYLSDFGINTLGYFDAEDNERNAYHIDGDEDDEYKSGETNKLKDMIASDPDTVVGFFSQLSKNLYDKMSDLSSSMTGYRSYGTFYYDKKLESDYEDYTDKIKDLEDKLAAYEDKWYDKFADMETTMAKMQSNVNAVTSLLGGS